MNIPTIKNLVAHGLCNPTFRGNVYETLLTHLSYTFEGRNLYAVIGEFGDGISVISNRLAENSQRYSYSDYATYS